MTLAGPGGDGLGWGVGADTVGVAVTAGTAGVVDPDFAAEEAGRVVGGWLDGFAPAALLNTPPT